jgi:hypothetical protein
MALAEHFVGRADELGSLERLLYELDRGHPGAIELAANRGSARPGSSGSSPLAPSPEGHLVLSGSASELERKLPFSVFVDALDEYVEGLYPEQLATLDDDVQAELAYVLPSLSTLVRGREVAPQQERYRTHRAMHAAAPVTGRGRARGRGASPPPTA